MILKTKILGWSAGFPVVMLNLRTAKRLGVESKDRILIKTLSKKQKKISVIADTIKNLVKEGEIFVSLELAETLNLKQGQKVDVSLSPVPASFTFIRKKLNNETLSKKEIKKIIEDIVNNSLSETEVSLFVSAIYEKGMSMKEIIYLIESMLETGKKITFDKNFVADKHSIGGVPGNRTTPIVISICAVAGLIMPKTSSRAITSAGGTADVIETVAKVDFTMERIKKIIKKTNACIVWGGSLGLVPADSKIIQVEKVLRIDPKAQLLASIMAKKLALGSRYILIDIPYGKTAKVDKKEALKLKKKFEYLGRYFKKKLKVVLTDGRQPIGNGVGPALELMDILKVLDPKKQKQAPKDLEKKSLFLAGEILEMSGKVKKGQGINFAKKILYSGKALEKFKEIIRAQEGSLKRLRYGKFKKNILSIRSGKISEIDNQKINFLARVTGCPVNKFSGLYLYYHIGDKVKKGEKILTLYSDSKLKLKEAYSFFNKLKPIKIL